MTNLIGLGGHLRAGKDAVADFLVEDHGFMKIGMSDPLNHALLELDPIVGFEDDPRDGSPQPVRYGDLLTSFGYVEAKKNSEVRRLLQTLGTGVVRDMIDQDAWVKVMARQVIELLRQDKRVVVTGIRFPNELGGIHALAGRSWWIERPGEAPSDLHPSERSLAPADFTRTIVNNSTLEALRAQVTEVFSGGTE